MHFSIFDKEKFKNNYLKGVSIKDLSIQSGFSEESIRTMLRNQGIEIVSNEIPKERKKRYWRRRKN